MAVPENLKIIFYPDPRLRKISRPVTDFGPELAELADRMLKLMREAKGVGLAAPQVGRNIRLFVMNSSGEPGDDRVLVNPTLSLAEGEETGEEGCLSIPDVKIDVLRSKTIKLTAQDLSGKPVEITETGYIARVWQHEVDHLNGVLLTDRMGALAKMTFRRKLKELEDKYATEHPQPAKKKETMTGLRLIFAGSGAFGLPALRLLAGDVRQVISQPDRPAGRGRKPAPTPIAQFALDHNLPLLRTPEINGENLAEADAMIVIAFGQKISQAQANRPRLGSINLHGSLLPKCRGAAPVAWTILRGETVTGNTVIRLAERMDAGAIVAQDRVEIAPAETAGELHDRLAASGAELVQKALDDLGAGRAVEKPQDEALASSAPKLTRDDAMIEWTAPAETVSRRICAMWPWPPCHVQLLDAAGGEIVRLSLARARAAAGEGPRWHAGEIETTGCVCAGGGAVEILQIQPEGRRVMTMAEFRRGHAWMPGMKLVSVTR